jgi:hypothetical protein
MSRGAVPLRLSLAQSSNQRRRAKRFRESQALSAAAASAERGRRFGGEAAAGRVPDGGQFKSMVHHVVDYREGYLDRSADDDQPRGETVLLAAGSVAEALVLRPTFGALVANGCGVLLLLAVDQPHRDFATTLRPTTASAAAAAAAPAGLLGGSASLEAGSQDGRREPSPENEAADDDDGGGGDGEWCILPCMCVVFPLSCCFVA